MLDLTRALTSRTRNLLRRRSGMRMISSQHGPLKYRNIAVMWWSRLLVRRRVMADPALDGDATELIRPCPVISVQAKQRTALALTLDDVGAVPWVTHNGRVGADR